MRVAGDPSPLYYPFAVRVTLDGAVIREEIPGLLLAPQPEIWPADGALVATATKSWMIAVEPFVGKIGRILGRPVFER